MIQNYNQIGVVLFLGLFLSILNLYSQVSTSVISLNSSIGCNEQGFRIGQNRINQLFEKFHNEKK